MSFGSKKSQAEDLDVAGVRPEDEPSNQEAVAKYWVGRKQVAVDWLSPIYNQRAEEAPQQRPGKK